MISITILMIAIQLVQSQKDELISVHTIYRHGARNPYFCNWACEEFKDQMEILTPVGLRQHYLLGAWLRQHYVDTGFLSKSYNEHEIYIQSTEKDRTIMSAYSNMQGLYPSGTGPDVPPINIQLLNPPNKNPTPEELNKEALPNNIQAVPVHMIEYDDDYILVGDRDNMCPESDNRPSKNNQTKLYQDVEKQAQPIIQDFIAQVQPKEAIYTDTFLSCIYANKPLPKGLKPQTLTKLIEFYSLTYQLRYLQTFKEINQVSTPFFNMLLGDMNERIHHETNKKLRIYASHDSTIQMVLSALNLTSVECQRQAIFELPVDNPNCIYTPPGFASNFIFELYNTSLNTQYVKVLYNGTYLNICSGGQTCLFTKFQKLLEQQSDDYIDNCFKDDDINYQSPGWMIAVFVILVIVLIAITGFTIVLYTKFRKLRIATALNEEQQV